MNFCVFFGTLYCPDQVIKVYIDLLRYMLVGRLLMQQVVFCSFASSFLACTVNFARFFILVLNPEGYNAGDCKNRIHLHGSFDV